MNSRLRSTKHRRSRKRSNSSTGTDSRTIWRIASSRLSWSVARRGCGFTHLPKRSERSERSVRKTDMQTFLPYPSFVESAAVLDYKRLGKQRVEAKQILKALHGETGGWRNHPATRMWDGYEGALCSYGASICYEWSWCRGYKDTLLGYFLRMQMDCDSIALPPWIGDESLHMSHRSNLIRKSPEYYGNIWPDVPDDLPYIWPV